LLSHSLGFFGETFGKISPHGGDFSFLQAIHPVAAKGQAAVDWAALPENRCRRKLLFTPVS